MILFCINDRYFARVILTQLWRVWRLPSAMWRSVKRL